MNITYFYALLTRNACSEHIIERSNPSVCLSCHLPNHLISYFDLALTVHTNTRQITPLSGVLFQNQAVANWLTYYPLLVQPKKFITVLTKAATGPNKFIAVPHLPSV